jgi:hypothetical protein
MSGCSPVRFADIGLAARTGQLMAACSACWTPSDTTDLQIRDELVTQLEARREKTTTARA